MSPHHDRDHFERVLFHPAADPEPAHSIASFGWSHPPKTTNDDSKSDPITRLEWLDDLMFAAIEGDPVALDCAADAWKQTREQLGEPALEESRRQYLRRAQTVWRTLRCVPNHPPHKVFAAIEIISLLAGKSRERSA
jgi:hypothetical protein